MTTAAESPQAPATVESPKSPAQPLATSAPPSPTASPQASSTTAQTSNNIKAQVAKYFEMMAEGDGDNLAEAQALTVPESPAWYYALALAARADAYVDSGNSEEPASYGEDDQGNPQICDPDAELGEEPDRDACVTFTGIQATPDEMLATFKVNDKPLSERISTTKGSSVTIRGAKFTRLACYRSASDTLTITVRIATRDQGLDSTGASSAIYRDSTGRQRQVNDSVGPSEIASDSNATVAMFLSKGRLGGTITMNGYLDDGDLTDVVARLRC